MTTTTTTTTIKQAALTFAAAPLLSAINSDRYSTTTLLIDTPESYVALEKQGDWYSFCHYDFKNQTKSYFKALIGAKTLSIEACWGGKPPRGRVNPESITRPSFVTMTDDFGILFSRKEDDADDMDFVDSRFKAENFNYSDFLEYNPDFWEHNYNLEQQLSMLPDAIAVLNNMISAALPSTTPEPTAPMRAGDDLDPHDDDDDDDDDDLGDMIDDLKYHTYDYFTDLPSLQPAIDEAKAAKAGTSRIACFVAKDKLEMAVFEYNEKVAYGEGKLMYGGYDQIKSQKGKNAFLKATTGLFKAKADVKLLEANCLISDLNAAWKW